MKRFPLLGVLLLIPALLMIGMVGCTPTVKDKTTTDPVKTGTEGDKGKTDKTVSGKKTDLTGALEASVTGTVKIDGKAPEMKVIATVKDHADAKTCQMGDTKDQTWMVNNDGRVANVVIILAPSEKDKKFRTDAEVKKLSTKTVHLDQPFCQYIPHVVGIYPAAQNLVSKNSAKLNHNVKIVTDSETINVNLAEGKDTEDKIKLSGIANETLLDAGCNIHPWMNAKIPVFTHPYFAVTNDKGEFKIDHVPIDAELTVYMWHESMGGLKDKKEMTKQSFKKGANDLGELKITGK